MVTVSFLLITAVWTHMGRMDGTTNVPGKSDPAPNAHPARMHVEVPPGDGAFVITMRRESEIVETMKVPRDHAGDIGKTLVDLQRAHASELGADESRTVVLHTDNALRYGDMVAVMDGIASPKDPRGHHGEPEFRVNLATK
jgi:hypothetical protein